MTIMKPAMDYPGAARSRAPSPNAGRDGFVAGSENGQGALIAPPRFRS